jgi:Domain of unknown function (DUF5077)/Domain of unknown function (DUF3472)
MFKEIKMIQKIGLTFLCLAIFACKNNSVTAKNNNANPPVNVIVPLAGNAFIDNKAKNGTEAISENGLINWSSKEAIISTYFKVTSPETISIALKLKTQPSEKSSIRVSINQKEFIVNIDGSTVKSINVGSIHIDKAGYVKIDLQGISKTSDYFAEVTAIEVGREKNGLPKLVFANDSVNYYWSRRGPSCHLNYTIPTADKEYFYSELTVPDGEDKIGSYFMAIGFGEGYFGIQVNSDGERRVLFSVWEPNNGIDKTTLKRKGNGVTVGRFDGEGTGGQSYLIFDWKAGTTYKFLTKGKPDQKGNTEYTSWFFAPEEGSWQLIASWRRPKISTYLTKFHGFLENFEPENGHLGRKANWSNQWVRLADGKWFEVTEFKFTVDATGKNKQRLDFAGGQEGDTFFLKNGGFFDTYTEVNTKFSKAAKSLAPTIDFSKLP